MALSKDSEGLSAGELQARSGAASNGSFYWHIHELEWLGVVQHNSSYKLTETGKEIVKALAKFL
jgi:predicted transcriptional regulator